MGQCCFAGNRRPGFCRPEEPLEIRIEIMPRNKFSSMAIKSAHLWCSLFLSLFAASSVTQAAEPGPDRPRDLSGLVGQCMTCHGPAGVAENPQWPVIAGQNELYLGKALRDFRSGRRQDGMMKLMTEQLTDRDISELAHYFSQIKPRGGLHQ
ncbi:MAG: cytochrome c [Candidatus Tokpelaia sp.]|nr:MAG: cytochrome c [Candidatus Tokpelaia sp.]KAA6207631.1 MAG: cytochrome c [Candidatus Tokpelaia sp.]